MKFKNSIISFALGSVIIFNSINLSYADMVSTVTIGVNNSPQQRQKIFNYFGVNPDEVEVIEINNQQERKYLEGIATEAQLGKTSYSCAYIKPTKPGSGINIKTSNLSWVNSTMVLSSLNSLNLANDNSDMDIVLASAILASGTAALTGIIAVLEENGQTIDESKKVIANQEIIVSGTIGDEVGQEKAAGIINDIKTEVIKNNTNDTTQIAEVINNVTNNYNITLSPELQSQVSDLMGKIAKQNYDYNEMKDSLENTRKLIDKRLDVVGEKPHRGFITNIRDWFSGIGDWFSDIFSSNNNDSILNKTNDELLGESASIDATDESAIKIDKEEVNNFFNKVVNWFKNLFSSAEKESPDTNENIIDNASAGEEILNSEIEDSVIEEAPVDGENIDDAGKVDSITIESDNVDDELEDDHTLYDQVDDI